MVKRVISIIPIFIAVLGKGQPIQIRKDLCVPMSVPLSISGNYGDIRSSSFHFGIDYTTNGQRGLPVFAIDSGYVSRIKVEAGGYGRALYVSHPYGITSVYAHLDSFSPPIAKFVKDKQYQTQSFAQDIQLDKGQFIVKKCELIGYSGNSGQSTGPHLHFELRKSENQNTINPYIFAFHGIDTIPPVLEEVLLYPNFHYLSKTPLPALSLSLSKISTTSSLKNNRMIREYVLPDTVWYVPAEFFIGISAYDNLVKNGKQLSFYASRLWLDNMIVFEMMIDELAFTEMSWVNGLIDYQRKVLQQENIYLHYLYPGFSITPVKKTVNNGIIRLQDSLIHQITIEISDFTGNSCVFRFKVRKKVESNSSGMNAKQSAQTIIPVGKTKVIDRGGVQVVFAPNSLYASTEVSIKKVRRPSLFAGYFVEVGHEAIPLRNPITIEFSVSNIPHRYWSKLKVARLKGNNLESVGGEIEGHAIKASTKTLGNFSLAIDTISPTIQFLNVKENEKITTKFIQVKVRDNLSGIRSWAGFIDGQWVLFEYDKKNDELRYNFDEKCIATGGLHRLELQVEDNCGNKSAKTMNFIY